MSTTTTATSSPYLSEKAAHLEAQKPVAPSQARAAQIPLKDFNVPTFPPEAFSAGLASLILTCDVKIDGYQKLLEEPYSVPKLPESITSLTLELFALGYPPGFLVLLGKALPNVRSLTLYSQLFAGTTPASQDDALAFLRALGDLREVHFLDVFTPAAVLARITTSLPPSVAFIEVSYTYRHSDPEFHKSIAAAELGGLVKEGMKALRLAMQAPDISARDEQDREGTEDGVFPLTTSVNGVMDAVLEHGRELVLLDLTLFAITTKDLLVLLSSCPALKVLALSVALGEDFLVVLGEIKGRLGGVESLELVGVPGKEAVEVLKAKGNEDFLNRGVLEDMGGELKAVSVSVLRTRGESWSLQTGTWEKVRA